MAISIGELVGTISLKDNFSGPIQGVGGSIDRFMNSPVAALTALAGAAVGAIVGVTAAVVALGERGSDVADVEDAFRGLTERSGETADVMLGKLREGTLGTIDNFELMKLANATLSGGLVTTADDMGTLAAGAKMMADRMGGSTAEAFETLSKALTKGTSKAQELKFMFEGSDTAITDYAAAHGKSEKSLTDHEKAMVKTQVGLANLKRELDANGPASVDFSDRIAQAKTALANFTDGLAKSVAQSPVLKAGMDEIAKAIEGAFGGKQEALIKTITGWVEAFALGLVKAAEVAVEFARIVGLGFEGSKVIVGAFLSMLAQGISDAAGLLATLAEKAKALPVVGEQFGPIAAAMREIAGTAEGVAAGFEELGVRGVEGIAEVNRKADAAGIALEKIEVAMLKAAGAAEEVAEKAPPAIKTVAEAADISVEALKKMIEEEEKAAEAAQLAFKDIQDITEEYQNRLTELTLIGVDRRLFEIDRERTETLKRVEDLATSATGDYQGMVDAIIGYYRRLREGVITEYWDPVGNRAAQFWEQSRADFDASLAQITSYFGIFGSVATSTYDAIKQKHDDYIKSTEKADIQAMFAKIARWSYLGDAVSGILTSLFGKSKAAAIAAAIIDAIGAAVKTLAAYPWPWSLIPAAAALAAGYAHVQAIRSTDLGFASGTPGTMFQDFGRASTVTLHGREAVVNEAQGRTLADMLAAGKDETAVKIEELGAILREEQRRSRAELPIMLRDAVMLARA